MLGWISNVSIELENTIKTVMSVVAVIVFIVNSHKGGWSVGRVVVSALVAGGVMALVWNLDLFAKRVETDIKSAPAIVATVNPHPPQV